MSPTPSQRVGHVSISTENPGPNMTTYRGMLSPTPSQRGYGNATAKAARPTSSIHSGRTSPVMFQRVNSSGSAVRTHTHTGGQIAEEGSTGILRKPRSVGGMASPNMSVHAKLYSAHVNSSEIRIFDSKSRDAHAHSQTSGVLSPHSTHHAHDKSMHHQSESESVRRPAAAGGGSGKVGAAWSNITGQTDGGGGDTLRLSWCVRMGMPEKYTAAAQERAKQVWMCCCMCVCVCV